MLSSPGRARSLLVIGIINLVGGLIVIGLGIGVSSIVKDILNSASHVNAGSAAVSVGVGYLISIALPMIIPGIFAIVAGAKRDILGLQVTYLVLVILGLIWLFGQTIGLCVISGALAPATAEFNSNRGKYNSPIVDSYNSFYALLVVSAVICLTCWCLSLAGSIITCYTLCAKDPSAGYAASAYPQTGQVVITTGPAAPGGYPAPGGYAPPPTVVQQPPAYAMGYPPSNAPPEKTGYDQ